MDSLAVLLVQTDCRSEDIVRAVLAEQDPPLRLESVGGVSRALACMERETFAAILLDLELPGAHEMDPFITLSQRAAAIPILAFATTDDGRGLRAIRAGAQDFLTLAELESAQLGYAILYAIERFALQREASSHAEQLQFSEARFRLLINENADAILVVNRAGVIRFANPAAAVLYDRTRAELVGTHFDAVADPNAAATIEIRRTQDRALAELRMVETLWNREQVYIVTLRDVTEQRRIATALQESEERYREFINASSEGIWRTDFFPPLSIALPEEEQIQAILFDSFIAECNDAMAHMYGMDSKEEMIGRSTDADVAPDDPANRELYRAFVRNGYRVNDVESHEKDRFGNPKIFLNNIYGIVRGGYLVGMWGSQRDVTLARAAEASLKRAQAQEQHQRELAQALADSAAALNSTLHYEQVLDRILENVGRVVPHDAASIFLIQGNLAQFVRGRGFLERGLQEEMEQLRLPIHEIGGYETMVVTGKPLLIPDTSAYAEWRNLARAWIKSYVGAPLRVQNQTIGFLNLDSETANFFKASHAGDLEAFAAQAATALENARLHTEARRRADDFADLYELTRELGAQRDLGPLLTALVERACKLLAAPGGILMLYVPELQELEPRVVLGTSTKLQMFHVKLGEGIMGRVAQSRQPLAIADYAHWKHRVSRPNAHLIGSAVCVPMLFGGELIGVMAVHEEADSRHIFSSADEQVLSLLATQGAALVHNVRLHEETEKRAQQLALLYDAGLALNSVLEPKTQLDFLTRIAMRSVGAERAVFFRFDPALQELALAFALGYTEDAPYIYATHVPLAATKGIEAWVARERLPAILSDPLMDPRFVLSGDGTVSGIWVPIEHDNHLLGVLGVTSARANAFGPHDQRLLLLFASQAAVALENARLYQAALSANERRAVLHWASQEIVSAGLDAERVYAAIHQATTRLMPCEAFVIAILDESGERINLPYLFDRGGRQPAGVIAAQRGISGHVISTGVPLNVDDLAMSSLDVINFGFPTQVLSLLAVPMLHGGKVVGMLSTQSYRRNAYTDDDRLLLEMLAAHAAAAVMNVRGAEEKLHSLEQAYLETVVSLAKAIDARDLPVSRHSERLAEWAIRVGKEMGMNAEELQALELASQLHDIGKIGVPDHILRKPGPLTDPEWEQMKRHPEIGAEILSPIGQLGAVVPLVRHHQECFDGTGYPDGLTGEAIPLGARILAVVDAFSAITDARVYKNARTDEEALGELKNCAGTQFDPQVVRVFGELWSQAQNPS